jgi:hypothetical protein
VLGCAESICHRWSLLAIFWLAKPYVDRDGNYSAGLCVYCAGDGEGIFLSYLHHFDHLVHEFSRFDRR